MRIVILGAGLMGVTTAYELGKRGHQVVVLDRQKECAAETSFANGGQLSYSHAEPWASPATLPKALKWMFKSDAPLVLRPRFDGQMNSWLLKFLRNCTQARAYENCVNMLRLGLYSRVKMEALRAETGIDFTFNDRGILHIYRTEEDYDAAIRQMEFQAKFGCEEKPLTRDECYALEPTLEATSQVIVGGIHAFRDAVGDSYQLCHGLEKIAREKYGVQFLYDTDIRRIAARGDSIAGIDTDKGAIQGDAYIMALGSYSPLLLRPLGINLPIYPMKGYSVTLDANDQCPHVSVTDGTHKIVYTRMGDILRISGTAEFAGYNAKVRERRIKPMVKATQEMFPGADWSQQLKTWACLRPSTPDGPPILGHSTYANLYLNTGHGTLGWTQAAGSAIIVSDIIEEKTPDILMQGLTMERYLV